VREERLGSVREERLGGVREERLGGVREERVAPARAERPAGIREEVVTMRSDRAVPARPERTGGVREERLGGIREERVEQPMVGRRTAAVAEEVVIQRSRPSPSGATIPPVRPGDSEFQFRDRPAPAPTMPAPPEYDSPPTAREVAPILLPHAPRTARSQRSAPDVVAVPPAPQPAPVAQPAPQPAPVAQPAPVVAVKPVLATTAPGTPGQNRIDRFLRLMNDRGASDLHLSVGRPPIFRLSGRMEPIRYRTLDRTDFIQLLEPIAPAHLWHEFVETGDIDFAYEVPGVSRFRVNLFRQERGDSAVLRIIPTKLMTVAQLGLPESIRKIVHLRSGLVLVTGPTGSGKSTTLSAIINEMNSTRAMHFVTIEDPIEFVHPNLKSLMSQREIGPHSKSFSAALRAAVREDPDAILVGEMRDLETISMALNAAETGVLVFGTLHTNSAAKTIDRVVNVFPADRQSGVRGTLASVLKGVVAQQLLRKKKGGRCAAVEILFGSNAMSSMIRDGKTHQISGLIKLGKKEGMIAMDDALKALVENDSIEPLAGLEKSIDKDDFRKWLKERGVQAPDDAH
jgi:twitching motility protein PilT